MNEVKFGPMGPDVLSRTYLRENSEGKRETWDELISRVVNGNLNFITPKQPLLVQPTLEEERTDITQRMRDMRIIPAGRHLWATGIDTDSQFIDNCFMVDYYNPDNLADHFCFTFMRLMEGGGVGTNYSDSFVRKLPKLTTSYPLVLICDPAHPDWTRDFGGESLQNICDTDYEKWYHYPTKYHVEDSREGWSKALEVMMNRFTGSDSEPLVINLTSIRPYGTKIRGFGGSASGPFFLAKMLKNIFNILISSTVSSRSQGLSSFEANLIDHEIAKAVVSGNVRRSARLGCKIWNDVHINEFIRCKEGNTAIWTANISVDLASGGRDQFRKDWEAKTGMLWDVSARAHKNGEPGIINLDLAMRGRLDYADWRFNELEPVVSPNPCGELYGRDLCCLGQVNMANHSTLEDMLESCRAMTRFLIRATFSKKPDPRLQEQVIRNRRIGVGVTGFHNWLVKNGIKYSESWRNPFVINTLRQMYETIRDEARSYSYYLRIPEPVKVTAIAPCGTISLLPGVAQGIHPVFALRFLRRTLYNTADANQVSIVERLRKEGALIEDSVYTPGTVCAAYLCEDTIVQNAVDPSLLEDAHDISIKDQLEVLAMFQEHFADNAVSFTANFDNTKVTVEEIAGTIVDYMGRVKGLTFMPFVHDRPQAPYTRLTKEEFDTMKKQMAVKAEALETECAGGACPVV